MDPHDKNHTPQEQSQAPHTPETNDHAMPPVQESPAPEVSTRDIDYKKMTWLGLKFHLADVGISVIVGIIFGLILGAFNVANETLLLLIVGVGLGLLVSAYVAYTLFKTTTQELAALISLSLWGVVIGLLGVLLAAKTGTESTGQVLGSIVLQVGAYVAGWYVAKRTQLKLPQLKGGLLVTAVILGAILLFFTLLGTASVLTS